MFAHHTVVLDAFWVIHWEHNDVPMVETETMPFFRFFIEGVRGTVL